MFVFDMPLTGDKVVAGFQCTQQAERFIAPVLMQECPFLNEELFGISVAYLQRNRRSRRAGTTLPKST